MKRRLFLLVFALHGLLSCMGQVIKSTSWAPAYRMSDSTSIYSAKYANNFSHITFLMGWIENNRLMCTDHDYVMTLDSAYAELKSFCQMQLNYARLDKRIKRIHDSVDRAINDARSKYSPYELARKDITEGDEADSLLLGGLNYTRDNIPDKALTCFKQAVEKDSSRLEYECFVIWEQLANADTTAALTTLNTVLHRVGDRKPKYYNPFALRAWLLEIRKDYPGALSDWNRALSIEPGNPQILISRANAKLKTNDYAGAVSDLQEVWLNPKFVSYASRSDSANLFNSIAWNYFLMKNYPQCMYFVERSLALNPDFDYALDTRGCGYYGLGEFEKCVADLTKAIGLNPELANS